MKVLSKAIISVFQDTFYLLFILEVIILSIVIKSRNYEDLLRAFEDVVINETMDKSLLDPEFLLDLDRILRYTKDNVGINISLSSVLRSLRKRFIMNLISINLLDRIIKIINNIKK